MSTAADTMPAGSASPSAHISDHLTARSSASPPPVSDLDIHELEPGHAGAAATASTSTPPPSAHSENVPERRRANPRSAFQSLPRLPRRVDLDSEDEMDAEEQDRMRILDVITSARDGRLQLDGDRVRAHQILRGQMSIKRVASKSAISSMESVSIDSLPKGDDRKCVICYNEFGVQSPEGISEAPLRLPSCKHVFGDHCIKKWFEGADSCPYCRRKVPSEPHMASTAAFESIMTSQFSRYERVLRAHHSARAAGLSNPRRHESPAATPQPDRRSPPSEAEAMRRRQRARHSSRFSIASDLDLQSTSATLSFAAAAAAATPPAPHPATAARARYPFTPLGSVDLSSAFAPVETSYLRSSPMPRTQQSPPPASTSSAQPPHNAWATRYVQGAAALPSLGQLVQNNAASVLRADSPVAAAAPFPGTLYNRNGAAATPPPVLEPTFASSSSSLYAAEASSHTSGSGSGGSSGGALPLPLSHIRTGGPDPAEQLRLATSMTGHSNTGSAALRPVGMVGSSGESAAAATAHVGSSAAATAAERW